MSVVLFVLGAWVLVSVAMGFLLGWACGLNQLSSDAGACRSPWHQIGSGSDVVLAIDAWSARL